MGGATGRTPPIPRSALEKDPRPGPLFEGNPVAEGTTRRGTASPSPALFLGRASLRTPRRWSGLALHMMARGLGGEQLELYPELEKCGLRLLWFSELERS